MARALPLGYFATYTGARHHAKMAELGDLLSVPDEWRAMVIPGLVQNLWDAAAQRGEDDGFLGNIPPRRLARDLGWRGEPAVLLSALVEAELIVEVPGGGWRVHDWIDSQHGIQERIRKRGGNLSEEAQARMAPAAEPPGGSGSPPGGSGQSPDDSRNGAEVPGGAGNLRSVPPRGDRGEGGEETEERPAGRARGGAPPVEGLPEGLDFQELWGRTVESYNAARHPDHPEEPALARVDSPDFADGARNNLYALVIALAGRGQDAGAIEETVATLIERARLSPLHRGEVGRRAKPWTLAETLDLKKAKKLLGGDYAQTKPERRKAHRDAGAENRAPWARMESA